MVQQTFDITNHGDISMNKPWGQMENSTFYQEFVISKKLKIAKYWILDLKLKEKEEGVEKLHFE